MKNLLILLLLLNTTDPTEISRYNRLKNKAEVAFENGQFDVAAQNYSMLYDSLNAEDPAIALNLAHSYFALGDSSNARLKYQAAVTTNNKRIKSIAYQQLGVMADNPKTLNEALQYLKSALKADPSNEEARYNYELVKKKLEKQQQNQQDQQNDQNKDQDQKNEDQENEDENKNENSEEKNEENSENENKEGENEEKQDDQQNQDQEQKDGEQKDGEEEQQKEQEQKDQQGEQNPEDQKGDNKEMSTQEKLEQMNISEEKAQMILEAMKNNEIQYIQQQRRKPTKARESGKPDW